MIVQVMCCQSFLFTNSMQDQKRLPADLLPEVKEGGCPCSLPGGGDAVVGGAYDVTETCVGYYLPLYKHVQVILVHCIGLFSHGDVISPLKLQVAAARAPTPLGEKLVQLFFRRRTPCPGRRWFPGALLLSYWNYGLPTGRN